VGLIGFIFAKMFNSPLEEFLPHFAAGQIMWTMIAAQLNESCSVFIQYKAVIKQIAVPLSVHVLRKMWYNLILLFHNAIIIIAVLFIFGRGFSAEALFVVPALALVCLLLVFISVILGIVCTRFRDIAQIVAVFMQLIFFFTPIFWMKKSLPDQYSWVSDFNPFYHMIEIIRSPLLGESPEPMLWLYLIFYVTVTGAVAMLFIRRYQSRVAYWL